MTPAETDTAALISLIHRLRNVRRMQTGARAAATQRKLESACATARAAGITDAQIIERNGS